jgi:hypothetical protein
MMRLIPSLIWLCVGLLTSSMAVAQPYVQGGNTRHRFAQLTLGGDLLYIPAGGQAQAWQDGRLETADLPHRLQPRLSIGGTHFWGHAEFYVAFDLPNLLSEEVTPETEYRVSSGVETAFKLYPWRLERGRLCPFLGSGMGVPGVQMRQGEKKGRYLNGTIVPLMAGFTYQRGNLLWELGGRYRLGRDLTYHVSRTQATALQPARLGFFAGLRYQIETTLSAEAPYQDGRTDRKVAQLRQQGRLSGFSVGVGPSSAFNILPGRSTYNQGEKAFLGDHEGADGFLEYGLGYYHAPWDAHLNLAYRHYRSQIGAYDFEQQVGRRAFTLEAYKFLFDYHGFVPFMGPSLSWDRWTLTETDTDEPVHAQREKHWLPGLSFGWDIRPDQAQWLILRTNLRYTPFRMHTPGDTQLTLHQLEFNFIQVVI